VRNWYGREETLRWSDAIIDNRLYDIKNYNDFFIIIKENLLRKKGKYMSFLQINDGVVSIDCKEIQSYWVNPPFIKELKFDIKVIDNKTPLEEFFLKIQSDIKSSFLGNTKINDIVDIYHLYSIYNDGNINEIWSCNQLFVKRHKKYFSSVDEFKHLFDESLVKIKRIK